MMNEYLFSEIASNKTVRVHPSPGDEAHYVGLEHMSSESFDIDRWGSDAELKGDKLAMSKGDILFGRRRAYQRKVSIAPFDGIFSAHGMILVPNESVIDKSFFPFFIRSDYFMNRAINISVGSLSPTLNWSDLKKESFFLPDLNHQKEVATLLWKLEDLKKHLNSQLFTLDLLIKSRFIEMFGNPDTNPFGWDTGHIADVVSSVKYGTSKPAISDGKYKYLRMSNITDDGHLDLSDLKTIDVDDSEFEKYVVRNGDVLFNRTNSGDKVGKTCVFNSNEPMIIAGYIIRIRVNERCTPGYLSAYLNSKYGKICLMRVTKDSVCQSNINAKELQSIDIIIPPKEVQEEYDCFVKQVDKSKFMLKKHIEDTKSLQQAVINICFEASDNV